ncbi:sensor domain-containing protein [Cellulosimicrobium funkei]|nr:sensor domain-containing protein [Cellulosimicrobium funkei]
MKCTLTHLGRDYAYVLPGFFVSLFAFILLLPLFTLALGTAVIWIGVWLLPIVLLMAGGFAELSRSRVRLWGGRMDQPAYRERGSGAQGLLRYATDPRRWLDLLFETLIAFPMRTVTFVLSVTWTAVALGGLTYVLWGHYIPRGENEFPLVGGMLEALTGGAVADGLATSYLVESLAYFALGVLFTLTLPPVMRGIALLDASTTAAALGAAGESGPTVAGRGPTATAPTDSTAPTAPARVA